MRNGLFIDGDGAKIWYKDGKPHNENGPAYIHPDGTTKWLIDGKYHRLDGPAEEYSGGEKYWWYENQYIECSFQEEFEKLIRLKVLW